MERCERCDCGRPGIIVDVGKIPYYANGDGQILCYIVLIGLSKRKLSENSDVLVLFDDWCKNPVCWEPSFK